MRKHLVILAGSILTVFAALPIESHAAAAWYYGVVTRINMVSGVGVVDGTFYVTLDSSALNGCANNRVHFRVSSSSKERVAAVFSLAMVSLTTGRRFGVVIDKQLNGSGGECNATGQYASLE